MTNLEDEYRIITAPKLYAMVEEANKENLRANRKELPKYTYPNEVVTSALIGNLAKYGQEFKVKRTECYHIRQLEAQKEYDKAIYGGGFLISKQKAAEKAAAEKAAAEKAAAEKKNATSWKLSENEKRIIEEMS